MKTLLLCMALMGLPGVYWSPNGGFKEGSIQRFNAAKSSILIFAYEFTEPDIASALVAARKRGVDVKILLDSRSSTDKRSQAIVDLLLAGKVDVYLDGRHNLQHAKIAVIDGKIAGYGSTNWTKNGDLKNLEFFRYRVDVPLSREIKAKFLEHIEHAKKQ
jgi:phosphatidylserine/phosphatidylglycerophosphate/cardiolipin synthase-like enzyme